MRVVTNAAQAPRAHRRRVSNKILSMAAAMVVAGMASSASAQIVWDGGGSDNNWSTQANWSEVPVLGVEMEPTQNDNAVLNNGDTILVNQSGEVANIFAIGSEDGGTGTLNMVAGDLSVLDFDVGQVTGGSGTLQMDGGVISTRGRLFRFGVAEGSSGNLQMTGGEINLVTDMFDLFLLGDNGDSLGNTISGGTLTTGNILGIAYQPTSTADLTVSDTAQVVVQDNLEIGRNRSATSQANGTINMTGGTIDVTGGGGDVVVGFNGLGTLNLSGGTINTVDNLVLGVAGALTNEEGTFAASRGTVNQSGGTINSQIALIGEGGDAVYDMTGGAINANLSVEVGRFSQSAVFTQSNGTTVTAGNREFFGDFVGLIVGDSGRGTYNLTDNASFTTTGIVMIGAFGAGNGDINQSGSSTLNAEGMIVAKRGTGVYNQSGGTANFANDIFLGDFDNTNATYLVSGGELNVGGNLNVAAALASNAPENPEEPNGENGAQGQAANVQAMFNVQGSDASINIGGDLLANPADKADLRSGEGLDNISTLVFDLDAGGISTIFVDGVADLDGATIDLNDLAGYLAANGEATLIDAAGGFANGGAGWVLTQGNGEGFSLAAEDQPFYDLNILSNGSGGEMLVATLIPEPTALAGLLGGVGLLLRRRRGQA